MIKDMVVNLGLGEHDPAGDYAAGLAEIFQVHVLGVAFSYEPMIPGNIMGGIPPEFLEAARSESEEKARAAVERFEAHAKRLGLSADHRILTATVAGASGQLGRIGRRFDLIVVGQSEDGQVTPTEIVDETVLFEAGRPVIFVPYIQKGAIKLDRIVVGWDGSRAAARAIADAMPFLQKAKWVDIVIVASEKPKSDELPGADLGEHLARHGVNVEVKRIISPDIDVASTILSHTADSGADMIVMGGYGHSRLREFVLGGVTRALLESMTVPVLMSH